MSNKHFCQGSWCHTYSTTDRFLKSKGIIRGRYARLNADDRGPTDYYQQDRSIFVVKVVLIVGWLKIWSLLKEVLQYRFIRERRFTPGYKKTTTTHEGYNGGTYKTNSIEMD